MAATSDPSTSSLAYAPSYAGPWSKLQPGLHPTLYEHVTAVLGFAQMTPVQSSVIPLFLSHKDVIVEAVTGSGKTLAYVLPVMQMMLRRQDRLKKAQIGALIVCPTRELAIQVHGVVEEFLLAHQALDDAREEQSTEASRVGDMAGALLAVGGATSSPADDYRRFKEQGSDIVVGTPGRVEELLKRPGISLKELEVLILDEADRLLDMGFHQQLTTILNLLPKQRRTGLFSATMTDALGELARVGLRNPVRVVVKVETRTSNRLSDSILAAAASSSTSDKRMPASLENCYVAVRPEHKMLQTVRILRSEAERPEEEHAMRKAIVYFATCAQVNYFFKVLSALPQLRGLKLYSLHGKQTPARRRATFDAFVSATPLGHASPTEMSSVLLCTDVAARGLDLPNVDLVVQFDPPTDPKVFSHRCGRTARAGRHGRAIVMLTKGREEEYVEFLKVRKNPVRPYSYVVDESVNQPATVSNVEPDELDAGAKELHDAMRAQTRSDRAVYEMSMQAFVSYVQCYRKHEVSFVFRERDLDFGAVAYTFGLLRLPRMPEVERWRKSVGDENTTMPFKKMLLHEEDVNLKLLPFADKAREKQRQTVLDAAQKIREQGDAASEGKKATKRKVHKTAAAAEEAAWSQQKAAKERRQLRRDKKKRKRDYLARQSNDRTAGDGAAAIADTATDEQHEDDDGVDDWADEERKEKKTKRTRGSGDIEHNFDGL